MSVTSFKKYYLEEKKKARVMRGKKGKTAKKSFSAKKRAKKNAPPVTKGANPKGTVKPTSKGQNLSDDICKQMCIAYDTTKAFSRVVIAKEHYAGATPEKVKGAAQKTLNTLKKEHMSDTDGAVKSWWKIADVKEDDEKKFITVTFVSDCKEKEDDK